VLGINHIAFRTPDPVGLRAFYLELLDAEALTGRVVRAVHKDEIHDGLRGTESAPAFLKSTPGVG